MTPPYATATAFRQALEARLMNLAREEGTDIQRLRRQLAFDRLLCRLFHAPAPPWLLKGGYAMELRIADARTTRDVDLGLRAAIGGPGPLNDRILSALQDAAAVDLSDFLSYAIGRPIQDLDGAPYGGARYPVEARMDGRTFATFHIDVGAGDAVIEPPDEVRGRDWLGFAGIPARAFPAISKEQQFAEKIHAYTQPRDGAPNSRVRDMVDLYLLVRLGLDPAATRAALTATFQRRAVQSLEASLPPPSKDWTKPFAALAAECGLAVDLDTAFAAVAAFYATLGISRASNGGRAPAALGSTRSATRSSPCAPPTASPRSPSWNSSATARPP